MNQEKHAEEDGRITVNDDDYMDEKAGADAKYYQLGTDRSTTRDNTFPETARRSN